MNMRRGGLLLAMAALAACASYRRPPPHVWMNDLSFCGTPAGTSAGTPVVLTPEGVTGPGIACVWKPKVDLEVIGSVERSGSCAGAGATLPAHFLFAVDAGKIRLETDHASIRLMNFSACPLPGEAPLSATGDDSGLTGVDAQASGT